jgi:hypothetical protein
MDMMKIISLITLMIFSPCLATCQIFSPQWQKCFGGSSDDLPYDMLIHINKYLIVGGTESDDGDISIHYGGEDGWVIMTDSVGNNIWERTYGGSLGDGFVGVHEADGGNFYLTGGTWSSDGTIGIDPYPDSEEYWIIKIDSIGNILWEKLIGGSGLDLMWESVNTSDGGIVVVGWTSSEDGDVSQYFGGYDTWVVKLNGAGEIEWDKTIGTINGFEFGQAIIQTSDGGYLVGISANPSGEGNVTCVPHSYNAEGILVKLDQNGNEVWQQCYGGSNHDGITLLFEQQDGYIFSGYTSSVDGDLTGAGYHGEDDVWMAKIDFDGNSIWHKCFGGSRGETIEQIFQSDNGNCKGFGITSSHDGDVIGNHSNGIYWYDIWVIDFNPLGEIERQQCFGGAVNETLEHRGVAKKSENNFIIAGTASWSPSFDVNCDCYNNVYPDFWVFEILDTTVNINEHVKSSEFELYPNPASEFIHIKFMENGLNLFSDGIIELYNIYGEKVDEIKMVKIVDCYDYNISELIQGLYFIVIKDKQQTIFKGKFLIAR